MTTEVVGNCGFSPAPVSDEFLDDLRGFALHVPAGMDFRWRSVGDYLRAFDSRGTALNVIQLIGHGTLRVAAMGFARRRADARPSFAACRSYSPTASRTARGASPPG